VGRAYYLQDPDQIFFGNAGSGSVYNENGTTTLVQGPLYFFQQRCGTVIIFYGSGSDLRKVMVPVPVPVPTYEKLWFRFRFQLIFLKSYGSGSSSKSRPLKANFSKIILEFFCLFYIVSCFTRKKCQQNYCKMWMKKILNEGYEIHNFISSSGSDFLTSYGSGSASQKVTVLRFRFRFQSLF
jgi:hypothetical protein